MSKTVLVVGAGVIGLAIAREISAAGYEVILCEKDKVIGSHTSSRNSGVIHAGIYYPQNSLKAKLCKQGKELLYKYCNIKSKLHNQPQIGPEPPSFKQLSCPKLSDDGHPEKCVGCATLDENPALV